MNHSRRIATIAAILGLAIGCQQRPAEEAGEMTEPAVDVAAEERAINDLASQYEQAYAAKDLETLMGFWTDDARSIYPDGTEIVGRDAIRAEYERLLAESGDQSFEIEPAETVVAASGDVAYEIGSYRVSGTGADGTPISETHRYIVAFQKVNGAWKLDAAIDTAAIESASETTVEGPPGEAAPGQTQ